MRIYLVRPDTKYYEQYNEMMKEWTESNTDIAPWFLNKPFNEPFNDINEFERYVNLLLKYETESVDPKYTTQSDYFAVDENDRLVGAGRLAHNLYSDTYDENGNGFNVWGHIGYGVRPSERKNGYGTQIARLLLEKARGRNILKVFAGVHDSNTGSIRVIENCGGILEKTVFIPEDTEQIRIYSIDNKQQGNILLKK